MTTEQVVVEYKRYKRSSPDTWISSLCSVENVFSVVGILSACHVPHIYVIRLGSRLLTHYYPLWNIISLVLHIILGNAVSHSFSFFARINNHFLFTENIFINVRFHLYFLSRNRIWYFDTPNVNTRM